MLQRLVRVQGDHLQPLQVKKLLGDGPQLPRRAMDSISSQPVRNRSSLWMMKIVESIVFYQSSVVSDTWRMLKGNCLAGT